MNNKAQTVNEELVKRGKKPLLPSQMFPMVFQHLKLMGMNVLTQTELDTSYGDPDLRDRLNSCIKDWDMESRQVAKERKAAAEKWHCQLKTAEKRDTAPGLEEAGGEPRAPAFHNIVMPAFPLQLGDVLAQCTGYSEIDVLERGSTFLRKDMSDGEITERVITFRGQVLNLMRDPRLVTAETWGRLSVFSLKPDIHFLHQFLEANKGCNRLALVTLTREARARVILWEMATIGMLALVPPNFIIY